MLSEKYENQIFAEKVEILEGTPTFKNCIFEKGVYVKGNHKRYFTEGDVVRAVFKSCTFRSKGNEPCVTLWERAQGEFCDCKMASEKYVPIRIELGSRGVFQNCSISTSHACGGAVMSASGLFENCRFSLAEGCTNKDLPVSPIYVDEVFGEEILFSKCSFSVPENFKGPCSYNAGWGKVSFDQCNFSYPKVSM